MVETAINTAREDLDLDVGRQLVKWVMEENEDWGGRGEWQKTRKELVFIAVGSSLHGLRKSCFISSGLFITF